jgi:hypothetical protein
MLLNFNRVSSSSTTTTTSALRRHTQQLSQLKQQVGQYLSQLDSIQ